MSTSDELLLTSKNVIESGINDPPSDAKKWSMQEIYGNSTQATGTQLFNVYAHSGFTEGTGGSSDPGDIVYSVTTAGSTSSIKTLIDSSLVVKDNTFIISFDAKSSKSGDKIFIDIEPTSGTTNKYSDNYWITLSYYWRHYTQVITINNDYISGDSVQVRIVYYPSEGSTVYATGIVKVTNIMLETGSTEHDYVEYSDGTLAPNVNSPQEMVPISQLNFIIENGKNLFNFDNYKQLLAKNISNGTVTIGDGTITLTATADNCFTKAFDTTIKVSPNTSYTMSWEYSDVNDTSGSFSATEYIFENGTTNYKYVSTAYTKKKLTITTDQFAKYITIRFGVGKSGDSITFSKIQVEQNSTSTEYTDYVPRETYTMNLSTPLRSVGETKDIINLSNGSIVRYVKEISLNNLSYTAHASISGLFYTVITQGNFGTIGYYDKNDNIIRSNYFHWNARDKTTQLKDWGLAVANNNKTLYLAVSSDITTVAQLKTFFSSHNCILDYKCTETIDTTTLTEEDVQYLKKLSEYVSTDKVIFVRDQDGNDVSYLLNYACPSTADSISTCQMTFSNQTDGYTSQIVSIGGNTIKNSEEGTIVYASVYYNDTEVDQLLGEIGYSLPSSALDGEYYYLCENNAITLQRYVSGYGWAIVSNTEPTYKSSGDYWIDTSQDPMVLKTYGSSAWSTVKTYGNGVFFGQDFDYDWKKVYDNGVDTSSLNQYTKVAYISNQMVSNMCTIQCTIDSIAICKDTFIDLNDPVISATEPVAPSNGQLWLDISYTPSILKIYNSSTSSWETAGGEQNKIFTSVPLSTDSTYLYQKNDLWIVSADDVNDGYTTSGGVVLYTEGTLLVATASSVSEFSIDDWSNKLKYDQEIQNLTEYTDKLQTYFTFEQDGLKIGQSDTEFYSKITPFDLGFYQGTTKVAYISDNKMYNKQLEVENNIKLINYPDESRPGRDLNVVFTIGDFQFVSELNGSLSIVRVLNDPPKPYVSNVVLNSGNSLTIYIAFYSSTANTNTYGYTTTYSTASKITVIKPGATSATTVATSNITTSTNTILIDDSVLSSSGTYTFTLLSGLITNTGNGTIYNGTAIYNEKTTFTITR